ncbi:MAG: triose-phosphate isomerase, partial [Tardiphaga sp.]
MTDAVRPLIAGNWKMNGLQASMAEFDAMLRGAPDVLGKADLLVCPPFTLVAPLAQRASSFGQETDRVVTVGAQDCHSKASGAHTGDVSAE